MVVRDDSGALVFIKTKLIGCKNVKCAELAALQWASSIAEQKGWIKLQWSSDAKGVVDTINSSEELDAWDTCSDILQTRESCPRFNWDLFWNHRSANQAADSIAAFSLNNNIDCCFNCFDFELLTQNLKLILINESREEIAV